MRSSPRCSLVEPSGIALSRSALENWKHRYGFSSRHIGQVPQEGVSDATIGSPALTWLTPGPTSSTIPAPRSEEHTSELQSLMRKSYSVLRLKKKQKQN